VANNAVVARLAVVAAKAAYKAWTNRQAQQRQAQITPAPNAQPSVRPQQFWQQPADRPSAEMMTLIGPALQSAQKRQNDIALKVNSSGRQDTHAMILAHEYAALTAEIQAVMAVHSRGSTAAAIRSALAAADQQADAELMQALRQRYG
jgi:hypothetical protein